MILGEPPPPPGPVSLIHPRIPHVEDGRPLTPDVRDREGGRRPVGLRTIGQLLGQSRLRAAHVPVGDEAVLEPFRVVANGLDQCFQHDPTGLLRRDPPIAAAARHPVGDRQQHRVRRRS